MNNYKFRNGPNSGRPFGTYKGTFPASFAGKRTPAYSRWTAMIQRCTNPNSHIWKYYGERGIKVCAEWQGFEGYQQFVRDMGEPPKGLWLDRKDNAGDYCKANCHWVTPKQQANNRRKGGPPVRLDSLRQRSLKAGLPYHMVYQRIKLLGWTEQDALTIPRL